MNNIVLALTCGPAKYQCCTTTVTVVVYMKPDLFTIILSQTAYFFGELCLVLGGGQELDE